MQTARRQVNRLFDKALRACSKQGWLADTEEGYLNERRVLAIASTHKERSEEQHWERPKRARSPSSNRPNANRSTTSWKCSRTMSARKSCASCVR